MRYEYCNYFVNTILSHFQDLTFLRGATDTPLYQLPLATHRYFCSRVF